MITITIWWTIVQILALFSVIYLYIHRKYSYWSERGIDGPSPVFPFGHLLQKARTPADRYELEQSAKYGKVYGVYTGFRPSLTISDADLIKQVLVKDFSSYPTRRTVTSLNKYWDYSMTFADAKAWKRLRSIVTPAFTSLKLKQMTNTMMQCVGRLEKQFEKISSSNARDYHPRAVMTGFSMDVIALIGFATVINTNEGDRSKQNPFIHHGINIFNMNPFRLASLDILPKIILKLLNITTMFPDDSFNFFTRLSWKIYHERKSNPSSKRNDLLQMLMDAFAYEDDLAKASYSSLTATLNDDCDGKNKNGKVSQTDKSTNKTKTILSENEVIAQCIAFLTAGFETTASTLTHALFELARNPDVQERLHQEISQKLDEINRETHFDKYTEAILNNMPYLEAVINETLRMHPILVRIERQVAVDQIKLAGIPLNKNVLVEIPTIVVHRNPEYYPEPDRFKPERFLPENKHLLVPYTFLPFGIGPRNCVGIRFAMQEAKLCLGTMLHKFKFTPNRNTPEKLSFLKGTFSQICVDFQLTVKKR